MFLARLLVGVALAFSCTQPSFAASAVNRGCVWRVTAPGGGVLYLGGSAHSLRSADYPLPPAYNRAFDSSERLVFEIAPDSSFSQRLNKAARYPHGDSLKNHVDPRTYEYLRRLFATRNAPEEKYAVYRPWYIALELHLPDSSGLLSSLGVEHYLARRAVANHKPMSGLESAREHLDVFSGLTDQQAEAIILVHLISYASGPKYDAFSAAWHNGDAEALNRLAKNEYVDFPAFGQRILDDRNRNWIPKIEGYLHSHHTYFVVAGAAHMGGPNGVLALLKARGYQIEQL